MKKFGACLALILGSIVFTLLVVESVSGIILKIRGKSFQKNPLPLVQRVRAAHEWPESLSLLPRPAPSPISNPNPPQIISSAYPNVTEFKDVQSGNIIRKIWTHTDKQGRRTYSSYEARRTSATWHLVGMGCSLTYGQAVEDEETFLANIANHSHDIITYNVGIPGGGPTEILYGIRSQSLLDDIQPKRGVGIYFVFDQHLARFMNSTSVAGTWRKNGLEFKENSAGQFEILGKLSEINQPYLLFARLWANSAFARLFNIDLPITTQAHLDQFFRMVYEIRREYRARTLPDNPFLVVIFPREGSGQLLYNTLAKTDLEFIDYSNLHLGAHIPQPFNIPGEGHPNPQFLQIFAKVLEKDIRAYLKEPKNVAAIH